MLKLNKYLREIGIDENSYPFNEKERQSDCRYKEDEDGFVPAEFWNLDTTFAMYIYSHLCYFRDNCNYGHPGNLSEEQWNNILGKSTGWKVGNTSIKKIICSDGEITL